MHPVSAPEWLEARRLLDNAPDGTILPWSYQRNGKRRLRTDEHPERSQLSRTHRTTHSFVKINGKIFALARGKGKDAIIGSGSFGKVKYGCNEQGERCLIKIGDTGLEEIAILQDLKMSEGGTQRIDNEDKYYVHMENLGKTLADQLGKKISASRRLQLAIELCLQVLNLHNGRSSQIGKQYAHRDIKPENITIDDNGILHLVDFGLAATFQNSDSSYTFAEGAEYYCPPLLLPLLAQKYDLIALMRTLLLPSKFKGKYDTIVLETDNIDRWSLLTRDMVDKYNLAACLDTSDSINFQEMSTTVLSLTAILITKQLNINIPWDELKGNESLCQTLVQRYQDGTPHWKIKFGMTIRNFGEIQSQVNNPLTTARFTALMTDLKAKRTQFEGDGNQQAYNAVHSIIEAIDTTLDGDYDNAQHLSNQQLTQFGEALHDLKVANKPVLESHRGVMGIFDTILTVLASFIVFYPVTYGYQKYNKVHCSFFKTETTQIVDEIDELLQVSSAAVA